MEHHEERSDAGSTGKERESLPPSYENAPGQSHLSVQVSEEFIFTHHVDITKRLPPDTMELGAGPRCHKKIREGIEEVALDEVDAEQAPAQPKRRRVPPFFVTPKADFKVMLNICRLEAPSLKSSMSSKFLKLTVDTDEEHRRLSRTSRSSGCWSTAISKAAFSKEKNNLVTAIMTPIMNWWNTYWVHHHNYRRN
ncbi:hypothetical protein HNY73_006420 [Argiope bruennichi]|uniref:Uncharacterized protein n=1 Tax=Argiope bruennichi TaxID=94029 RepID=A0A8T0FMY6_ARGBR|nr:hypothetical protein HNY73_006420 [Argiope bruennichi]